jgi:hypothetical protein
MTSEQNEKLATTAALAATGAAAGLTSGLVGMNAAAQVNRHLTGAGVVNGSSAAFHRAGKALAQHKGAGAAIAALAPSALVAAAPVAIAAAPFLLAAGAIGAAIWGVKKLIDG